MQAISEQPQTHLAIVLHPPSRNIRLEQVPMPRIEKPEDAIIKVDYAGLCGSDLHSYRGHAPFDSPFVMGHEVVGEIVDLGSAFVHSSSSTSDSAIAGATDGRAEGYGKFKIGDKVISAFSTSCKECEPCKTSFTSRCVDSLLIGTGKLPGGQAQYIRVPHAGGTLSIAPQDIDPTLGLLLADILPTGYFAVKQAFSHPNIIACLEAGQTLRVSVVGLGPVGMCAVVSLVDWAIQAKLKLTIAAIDPLEHRRLKVKEWIDRILSSNSSEIIVEYFDIESAPRNLSQAVLEVVGNPSALKLAYELILPFGVISSVGVHSRVPFAISPDELYNKNVSLFFGRCPARALFESALAVLRRQKDIFNDAFVEKLIPFSGGDASVKEAYDKFDKGVWGKVLFRPWE